MRDQVTSAAPFMDEEGKMLVWQVFFDQTEAWLNEVYPVDIFGGYDRLLYSDRSGIDTTAGHGPAAVRALRLAIALSRREDPGV